MFRIGGFSWAEYPQMDCAHLIFKVEGVEQWRLQRRLPSHHRVGSCSIDEVTVDQLYDATSTEVFNRIGQESTILPQDRSTTSRTKDAIAAFARCAEVGEYTRRALGSAPASGLSNAWCVCV